MIEWLQGLQGGAATFVGALTGSAIGLIALVLGALFNAHLNRKRDNDLRLQETRAVAASLWAELLGLEEALTENAKGLDTSDSDFFLPDPSHSVRVFPSVISKIGLLDVETIKRVIEAYIVVDQYAETLMILGGKVPNNMPSHRRVFAMPVGRAKDVADINRQVASLVVAAKQKLAPYMT